MFKSRRVDESVADLNWVLDSIQGIDPMDRLSVLDDSVFAWEAKLGELALSLGYEDTDELLDAISAGEIPDPHQHRTEGVLRPLSHAHDAIRHDTGSVQGLLYLRPAARGEAGPQRLRRGQRIAYRRQG